MWWLPGPHHTIFSLVQKIIDYVEIKIKEHRESFNPSSPRDYIDCFLTEMGEVGMFYVSVSGFLEVRNGPNGDLIWISEQGVAEWLLANCCLVCVQCTALIQSAVKTRAVAQIPNASNTRPKNDTKQD